MKFYRLLLLCAAAFALLLAACGDDNDSGGTTATNTTGATPTVAAAEAGPFFDCQAQHTGLEADASYFPVTVTDGGGTDVTIDAPPAKIASLDAAHTEILYAIGAADQVTAADNTSDCPAQAGALSARVDAFNPSVEAITALQPDLVVTAFDTGDIVASLRAAGIQVLLLPAPSSIDGTYEDIRLVGKVTGHADQADALVTSMTSEIRGIETKVANETAPSVYHELDNTYFSVGPGSFIDDLYQTLGAENISQSTGEAYPQLSSEAIIAANPDVIILADEGSESAVTVKDRPGWSAIDAVKNDRIYTIDPDIVSRSGPRIVDALQQLAADLYSETGG